MSSAAKSDQGYLREHRAVWQAKPVLRSVERFWSLTYLLSLGFKRARLLPEMAYAWLYRLEQVTQPLWERFASLRAVLVWEKTVCPFAGGSS